IVGAFNPAPYHSYVKTGSTFTTIDVPGSSATIASGINNIGQIVGYFGESGRAHGFIKSGATYTTIDVPPSLGVPASFGIDTFVYGINDAGVIVGTFSDTRGSHGFIATPISTPPVIAIAATPTAL